jgi:hypothetical protein
MFRQVLHNFFGGKYHEKREVISTLKKVIYFIRRILQADTLSLGTKSIGANINQA